MSISQDSYTFENPIHGAIQHGGFDVPIVQQKFFATTGEYHLIGKPVGRELALEISLDNKASRTLVHAAITNIANKVGQTGDLTIDGDTFPNCTFLGFTPSEAPFRDGSGLRGWVCRGTLRWRQRAS